MSGDRLSFNQMTAPRAGLEQLLATCRRNGIDKVGLWRHLVGEDLGRARELCDEHGITVTSLCRGGFFTGYNPDGRALSPAEAIEDTRRAIDEAHALGTDLLVLVCGGTGELAPRVARRLVADGIAAVAAHAADRGVRLGIEPLHPMFCAERSAVVTLAQALQLAGDYPATEVGVVIDAYHVWWDPELEAGLERCAERTMALHVCDWALDTAQIPNARALPGRGVIDLHDLRARVDAAGYDGPIEVEVLNHRLWECDVDEVVRLTRKLFDAHVAGASAA